MNGPTADNLIINGIDVQKGLAMYRGKPERYRKILGIFCTEGRQKAAEIDAAYSSKDMHLYTTLVHAIKSASANIGAQKLSEDSDSLESAGRQSDWNYITWHNDIYLTELRTIIENIERALAETAPADAETTANTGQLVQTLNEFKQALQDMNSSVINSGARALRVYSGESGIGKSVQAILHCKTRGDYEGAVALIDILLREL